MFSLAKKYGVTVKDLKKENKLVSDSIYVGQALSVPTHGFDTAEFTSSILGIHCSTSPSDSM